MPGSFNPDNYLLFLLFLVIFIQYCVPVFAQRLMRDESKRNNSLLFISPRFHGLCLGIDCTNIPDKLAYLKTGNLRLAAFIEAVLPYYSGITSAQCIQDTVIPMPEIA